MAESVYATDLKSVGFTALWVRVPPSAQNMTKAAIMTACLTAIRGVAQMARVRALGA